MKSILSWFTLACVTAFAAVAWAQPAPDVDAMGGLFGSTMGTAMVVGFMGLVVIAAGVALGGLWFKYFHREQWDQRRFHLRLRSLGPYQHRREDDPPYRA